MLRLVHGLLGAFLRRRGGGYGRPYGGRGHGYRASPYRGRGGLGSILRRILR